MVKKFNQLNEKLKLNHYNMNNIVYFCINDRALDVLITLIYQDIIDKKNFQEIVDNFTDFLFTEEGEDYTDLDKVYDLIEIMIEKGFDVNTRKNNVNDKVTIIELVASIEDEEYKYKMIDLLMKNGMKITPTIGGYIEEDAWNGYNAFKYIEENYPKEIKDYIKSKQVKKFKI